MATILEQISSQLGDDAYQKIGQRLGLDAAASKKAVENALPVLLGAIARNTQNPQGASSLASALDRDHDGSVLNNLDAFLKAPEQGKGAGILGQVLGGQAPGGTKATTQSGAKAPKSPQQHLLASLLDSDKDGDISDDLVNLGSKLLGGMFGKK